MKLMNVELFFDCREYRAGTPRGERPMAGPTAKIQATAFVAKKNFDEKTLTFFHEKIDEAGKPTGEGWLRFKIFPSGKYFKTVNTAGKLVPFPNFAYIDGQRVICNIDYTPVLGDASKMQARGNYVNAIQFIRFADVIFEPVVGVEVDFLEAFNDTHVNASVEAFNAKNAGAGARSTPAQPIKDDLPF